MAGNNNSGRKKQKETMETVYVKLPLELLTECKAGAKREDRTISAYIRKVLKDALAEKTAVTR